MLKTSSKIEFGDFQTPIDLAEKCTALISKIYSPELIIEPTCGFGSFLLASEKIFNKESKFEGYEINKKYIIDFYKKNTHLNSKIKINHSNFFNINWESQIPRNKKVLVIGNPPWVTSSQLGVFSSKNLPEKTNLKGLSGFEAKSGKSNFDISEWMLIKLSEVLFRRNGMLAMLVKTSVARKVFLYNSQNSLITADYKIHKIDAKKEFNASVAACLFIADFSKKRKNDECYVYNNLSLNSLQQKIGLTECGILVADIDKYEQTKNLVKGESSFTWRSGIKHDCSKIMELQKNKNGYFINGLNEVIDIEDKFIFPLLKSSDLANDRTKEVKKFVVVTQTKVGEKTEKIKHESPKLWNYLTRHKDKLAARKSSIYKNQPPFSIFGIGEYSFKPYKIAVSGLYKKVNFCLLSPYKNKEIMLDDTCYLLGFDNFEEAEKYYKVLQSNLIHDFIQSLIFWDAKRPINIDILKLLDLKKVEYLTLKSKQRTEKSFKTPSFNIEL